MAVFQQSVAGAVTPAGSLALRVAKTTAGTTTPAGARTASTAKTTAGTATPAGATTTRVFGSVAAWRISAWSHPQDPNGFALREHSIPFISWNSNDPLDTRGRCTLTVPETYDWQRLLATQNPQDPTDTSLLRLYRAGVDNNGRPDQEFKLVRFSKRITDDGKAVIDLFGIDWKVESLDPAVVRWWDWQPGKTISRQSDWSFGGDDQRNLLDNLGFRSSGSPEKQAYHVHGSAGTYTLTVPGIGTTVGIAPYEAGGRAADVKAALEGITGINEVKVSGKGHTQYDPLVVEFVDPQGDLSQMTLDETNLTHGGCAHPPCHAGVVNTINHGTFEVEPWTRAQYAAGGSDPALHGTYDTPELAVVDDPALAGDEQALRVDPRTSGAGAQQVVDAESGLFANATIEVQSTSITDEFYLRILDRWDSLLAVEGPITLPAADTWTEIAIDQITLPDPLPAGKLTYRIQVYSADGNSAPAPFLIRNPYLAYGFGAATIGVITDMLLEDAQTDHAPGLVRIPYINRGAWTDTTDEDGAAWTREEHLILRRGKHYGSQILGDQFAGLGYEFDVIPDAADPTQPDWDLKLWNQGGRGTTHADIAFHVGYGVAGGLVAGRMPKATRWLAEGAEGIITESVDTNQETQTGVYEEFFTDGDIIDLTTLQGRAQHQLDEDIANRMAITVELDDSGPIPYGAFDVGDLAPFSYFGTMATNERRISEIGLRADSRAGGEVFWTPTITASKLFTGDAAKHEAIYRLLREYKLLKRDQKGGGDITAQAFPFPLIAASDAPEWMKQGARWVCDGVSDALTIEEALNEMTGVWGNVYLTPGQFNINMTSYAGGQPGIDVPATVGLIGAGEDATFISLVDTDATAITQPLIRVATFATLRDFSCDSYDGVTTIETTAGSRQKIERVHPQSFDGIAIHVNNGDLVHIVECDIIGDSSDPAVLVNNGANLTWIEDCNISLGTNNIRVVDTQTHEIWITGNRLTSAGFSAISIEGTTAPFGAKVHNNNIDNWGQAAGTVAQAAIYVEGVAGEPIDDTPEEIGYGAHISENFLEAGFGHGIWLQNVTGADVTENYIEDAEGHGIFLGGDTDHSAVTDNRLFFSAAGFPGNTWDVIHVDGSENTIARNTTRDSEAGTDLKSRYALVLDGNDNRVYDNDLRATGETGTLLNNGTGNHVDIPQDWTPAWTAVTTNPTLGDGILEGRFTRRGDTVHATLRLEIGTTTTLGDGAWEFSLPFPPAATKDQAIGSAHVEDAGTGWHTGVPLHNATDLVTNVIDSGGAGLVAAAIPHAWAAGDVLTLDLQYEGT